MPYTEEEVLELAKRAYRSGDASFEIERGHCALLVIDMQNEFVRPKWTPYWVPEATRRIPTIRRLIEKCRGVAVPVIFTAFAASHQDLDRPSSGANMPNRFPRDPARSRVVP